MNMVHTHEQHARRPELQAAGNIRGAYNRALLYILYLACFNVHVLCRKNFHEDVPAILAVWVPAQFINFGFSPMWFRVPFVATVSAFWTGYVSLTRGAAHTTPLSDQGGMEMNESVDLVMASSSERVLSGVPVVKLETPS
jgi:hypothetical protein